MNLIVLLTTFVLFSSEALLHYNIGKSSSLSLNTLSFPSLMETIEIVTVVFVFSLLNSYLVGYIEIASKFKK